MIGVWAVVILLAAGGLYAAISSWKNNKKSGDDLSITRAKK